MHRAGMERGRGAPGVAPDRAGFIVAGGNLEPRFHRESVSRHVCRMPVIRSRVSSCAHTLEDLSEEPQLLAIFPPVARSLRFNGAVVVAARFGGETADLFEL